MLVNDRLLLLSVDTLSQEGLSSCESDNDMDKDDDDDDDPTKDDRGGSLVVDSLGRSEAIKAEAGYSMAGMMKLG